MKSRTVEVDEHEAVVDRDFLENVGNALLAYASTDEEKFLAGECIRIGNAHPDDEDEE